MVWRELKSNEFSIEICALVLLDGANKVGVPVNLTNNFYTDETQIKKILSRYNGTGNDAKLYGESRYNLYKIFEKYNLESRTRNLK